MEQIFGTNCYSGVKLSVSKTVCIFTGYLYELSYFSFGCLASPSGNLCSHGSISKSQAIAERKMLNGMFLLSYLRHCAFTANPKEITVNNFASSLHLTMQTTVYK